jgi:membrane protein
VIVSSRAEPTYALPPSRHLSGEAWRLAIVRAYHGFLRHRGIDNAAALSFFAALVLFPASLAIVSAFALIDDKARAPADILRIVSSVAPRATVVAIHGPLTQLLSIPNAGYALAIGLVLTLWTLSGYVAACGRAINTAYEVEEGRRWIPMRAGMLPVAVVIMIAGGAIVLLLSVTPPVAEAMAREFGLAADAAMVWDIAKWPVLAGLAVVIVGVLYYYSPNVRHLRIRWVSWGALLTIAAWTVATTGFAIYVLNFSHYNRVYGWLGGAIVLLLWLYLSNLVVVFGAEVDAEIVRVRQLVAGIKSEDVIQLPLRSRTRIETLERWTKTDQRNGRLLREREDRKRASGQRTATKRKG